MNPYLIGAGVLAFAAVITTVGYKAEEYGAAQVREQWSEEKREWERQSAALRAQRQNGIDEAAQILEKARNEKRIVYRTITQQVDRVVERDIYRRDCLDTDGMRLVADAFAGHLRTDDHPQPDAAVPTADAAGADRRGSAAEAH